MNFISTSISCFITRRYNSERNACKIYECRRKCLAMHVFSINHSPHFGCASPKSRERRWATLIISVMTQYRHAQTNRTFGHYPQFPQRKEEADVSHSPIIRFHQTSANKLLKLDRNNLFINLLI